MRKRRNNNGFSLVELIVVVLIMAIVAVALAPQVVKWVENSRIASDMETRTTLEKACQFALSDEAAFQEVQNGGYEIRIEKEDGVTTVKCIPEEKVTTALFWKNFFDEMQCDDYASFKDSIEIKCNPVTSPKIKMTVYVYEDGHTFSTLEGFSSAEIKEIKGISATGIPDEG